jgi:hypothetical protein
MGKNLSFYVSNFKHVKFEFCGKEKKEKSKEIKIQKLVTKISNIGSDILLWCVSKRTEGTRRHS